MWPDNLKKWTEYQPDMEVKVNIREIQLTRTTWYFFYPTYLAKLSKVNEITYFKLFSLWNVWGDYLTLNWNLFDCISKSNL